METYLHGKSCLYYMGKGSLASKICGVDTLQAKKGWQRAVNSGFFLHNGQTLLLTQFRLYTTQKDGFQ